MKWQPNVSENRVEGRGDDFQVPCDGTDSAPVFGRREEATTWLISYRKKTVEAHEFILAKLQDNVKIAEEQLVRHKTLYESIVK